MTNEVTKQQLIDLARSEAEARALELEIIQLKITSGVTVLERQLIQLQNANEARRREILERQQEYVNEHGKNITNEHFAVRAKNEWVYDEAALLPKLLENPEYANLVRTKTVVEIDKNELKRKLKLVGIDELNELGVTWKEGFEAKLKPLGELED